jgi:hypothetical protein
MTRLFRAAEAKPWPTVPRRRGRPTILPDQRAPRLTPKQREMLTQTIFAGYCVSFSRSTYAAAWSVRAGPGGGIERDFCQSAGDALLRLDFIELATGEAPPCAQTHGIPFATHRYVPTTKGLSRVRRWRRRP